MSEPESVDFFFRYRPAADSPDGVLLRYLLSHNPTQRKQMILKALRAFYLVAAYGDRGQFQQFSDVKKLMTLLEETYGENAIGSFDHSLSLDIDIGVTYSGWSTNSSPEEDE
ncbi:hypothetical protein IQ244_29590 [Nostoc sp. LEGE 06077]|uniref:hypothetical protein n=1 Tax=Nostoc sp. LEGE 06077 TaxID=915325 RepID=UPI001880E683|nr:hypothetical protein [Nostoc sp. LEGE 06077]MBE9210582.1 hypothetical protein [Nostoc sp. LEGE 06077]